MTRPIHVVYFTGDMGPGGSEAHLAKLIVSLDRSRVRPELLLMRAAEGHPRLEQVRRTGVPIHDLKVPRGKQGIPSGLMKLNRALARMRPDVIHSYGYPCDFYAALLVGWRRGMHVITSRRGNEPIARRRWLNRVTNPLVDRVVCVSTSAERFAVRTEGLSTRSTLVIPNGVDVSRFEASSRPARHPLRIGTHGRIRHVKGIDLLLEAFGKLGEQALELRIAGGVEDDWGAELQARYESSARVRFEGELEDVATFLRELDMFVLPSRSEGMSMALLEAMASGLPIVATRVGSNAELLENGEAGLLVKPEAASIAEGVSRLLADPALASRLGDRARRHAQTDYALSAMIERYHRLYEDTLAEGAGR